MNLRVYADVHSIIDGPAFISYEKSDRAAPSISVENKQCSHASWDLLLDCLKVYFCRK
jgi:hypothetical protein